MSIVNPRPKKERDMALENVHSSDARVDVVVVGSKAFRGSEEKAQVPLAEAV